MHSLFWVKNPKSPANTHWSSSDLFSEIDTWSSKVRSEMLDGILTRGFSSKWYVWLFILLSFKICDFSLRFWDEWSKSLVKATRTRIEVVRRRAESKQRFLKEDLAKLLDNGLDINAYGRVSVPNLIQFWFDENC